MDTETETDDGRRRRRARLPAMDPEMAANPQPIFKVMRDEMPVMPIDLPSGRGVLLSRKEEIDEALRHPEIFSSNMDAVDLKNKRPMIPLQIDPPEHKKFRKLLDPIFAPRKMALMDDEVSALVNHLIDGFIDRGEVDFAKEFSIPFPSQVFLTLLGPAPRRARPLPHHEGRHHPARPRDREAVRVAGGQRLPAEDRRLGLRLLQRDPRRA